MAFVSSFSALDAPIGASIYANLYNEVRVYNSKITVTTSGVQGSGSQGIGLVILPVIWISELFNIRTSCPSHVLEREEIYYDICTQKFIYSL